MSEVLAQLEKKGGETLIPTTPDALYKNNSMAYNGTATLAVTKKPRLLIWCSASTTNTQNYFVGLVDVENGTAYRYGYFDGANRDGAWTTWQSYFTSITDTSVGIKNAFNASCNIRVGAYY